MTVNAMYCKLTQTGEALTQVLTQGRQTGLSLYGGVEEDVAGGGDHVSRVHHGHVLQHTEDECQA